MTAIELVFLNWGPGLIKFTISLKIISEVEIIHQKYFMLKPQSNSWEVIFYLVLYIMQIHFLNIIVFQIYFKYNIHLNING